MSTFYNRGGSSPPPKPSVKHAFTGLVGRFGAEDVPLRFIGRSLIESIPVDLEVLLDGRAAAQPLFTMTAEQIRKAKYDERMRQKALTEKMVKLVALAYPKASKSKRNSIVEDALKDETLTAWGLSRVIKAVVDFKEKEQMYASALTNLDGTKMKDGANESHRHPIYAGVSSDIVRWAQREHVFDGNPPRKENDANAIELINNWRNEIHSVADQVMKAGGDLMMTGYSYKGVTMRLCTWLAFLELFPEDDPGATRQMIGAFLSPEDGGPDRTKGAGVVSRRKAPVHKRTTEGKNDDGRNSQSSLASEAICGSQKRLPWVKRSPSRRKN